MRGKIMDPEKIIDGVSKELVSNLKMMAKTNNINEKEIYSRIVKNLCESLGVFFDLADDMMPLDFDEEPEGEDVPF
jgi:ubiquinone biosynthesis protein COQ9